MGVSGSGKSTVGTELASRLGKTFHDADDFHSAESVDKMRAGEPLSDADREPWLRRLAKRKGHYMPQDLLDSQFEALEIPDDAVHVRINRSVSEIVDEIMGMLTSPKGEQR